MREHFNYCNLKLISFNIMTLNKRINILVCGSFNWAATIFPSSLPSFWGGSLFSEGPVRLLPYFVVRTARWGAIGAKERNDGDLIKYKTNEPFVTA